MHDGSAVFHLLVSGPHAHIAFCKEPKLKEGIMLTAFIDYINRDVFDFMDLLEQNGLLVRAVETQAANDNAANDNRGKTEPVTGPLYAA